MAALTLRRSLLGGVAGALLAVTLGASAVAAATRWVDDDGLAGPGGCAVTTVAPKRIQAAIDASGSDDTIIVCPGVYREELTVSGGREGLTIRAARAGTARIRARGTASSDLPVLSVAGVGRVTLHGLVLQAPTQGICRRVPVLLSLRDAFGTLVRRDRFEPIGSDTIGRCGYDVGIRVEGASNVFIDRVDVRDFRLRGVDSISPFGAHDLGIEVKDSRLLFLHAAEGPHPRMGAVAQGIRILRAETAFVFDNEVRSLRTARSSTPLLGSAIDVYDVGAPSISGNTVRYVTWGVAVFASLGGVKDNDIRFGRRSGQDPSEGLMLSGGDQLDVEGNVVSRFGYGIHADGGAHDHNIHSNDFRGNFTLDCWDETSGTGTGGTANHWTSNLGLTDSPDGIC